VVKSKASHTDIAFLGDLQIAPRELEKIKPEELPIIGSPETRILKMSLAGNAGSLM